MALGPLICFIHYYVENTILKMTYFLKNTLKKFFIYSLLRCYCFGDDVFLEDELFFKKYFL